jgi:hypothetical protein
MSGINEQINMVEPSLDLSPTTEMPQPDEGKEAYLVLFGCAILQLPIWSKFKACAGRNAMQILLVDLLYRLCCILWYSPRLLLTTPARAG